MDDESGEQGRSKNKSVGSGGGLHLTSEKMNEIFLIGSSGKVPILITMHQNVDALRFSPLMPIIVQIRIPSAKGRPPPCRVPLLLTPTQLKQLLMLPYDTYRSEFSSPIQAHKDAARSERHAAPAKLHRKTQHDEPQCESTEAFGSLLCSGDLTSAAFLRCRTLMSF